MKVFCACFLGQGGRVFSGGVLILARKLRNAGCKVEVFRYTEYEAARVSIKTHRALGYKIVGVGFSLGCTAVTYLALTEQFDAVLCIAESVYAGPNNHAIQQKNVKRSVLWRNSTEPLSAAGGNLGFDRVVELRAPHLLMPVYAAGAVVDEVMKLA